MNDIFTEAMVDKFANDLLIGLSREENKLVLDEFEEIRKNINLISEIENIELVEPMTHPFDTPGVELREDEVKESISIDDAFSNCDVFEGNEIKVPKVVE